jgi:hypothetical protein
MDIKRRSTFGVEKVSLANRFWSKVQKEPDSNGCWLWIGAKDVYGYGYLGATRRKSAKKAHRLSYEIHYGEGTSKGLCVLHRCDNPPCVNPSHLFLGTRSDNNKDKQAKGRDYDKRGENNPRAKIKLSDVEKIKRLWKAGKTQDAIAKIYKISQVNVSKIVRGQLWNKV